jgi:hypothetical protein
MRPRPAPVPTTLLGEACVRPVQFQTARDVSVDARGMRALYVELLREALRDAGVMRGIAPLQPRRQALAVAWLTGTIDGDVVLPVAVICDAPGIDASVLAAIVRARVAP